ncbi:myocardin related transcription factor Ab isoform X2 [Triplophysa dalaica]|uniref:myocardin related transcription factor Ab isoform X2 n=1 Tax=Triplophysa dalaica TaxID=1582913 RepID=UPI0024DFFB5D|nr:myocardin related transcription factor Ab isoform X2 [Triplophysa dalaica]
MRGEELSPGSVASAVGSGPLPSPQSEAVTSELKELSLQPLPSLIPLKERKNVLQLKLQQRRTREELVSQGIMPPLKSPAAFHEQRRSLERARTEDYLKRKIRSRPERSELVRMHILEETSAEPSLQAKQLKLKRARLADDLNDKISHRPGPIELVHKNILPVITLIESPKGESSSLDEDSSDALSPDPQGSQDSPLSLGPQHSPAEIMNMNGDLSPSQFLTQAPPPTFGASHTSPPHNPPNEITMTNLARPPTGQTRQSRSSTDRASQRSKKPKDSKPKVKKLKYHQYIPPDQKNEREPPPPLDSSYAKILHQQQLFLQLQIINQQQQHYNYHTILPAPPKVSTEMQQTSTNPGPSPSQTISTCSTMSSNQNGPSRQSQPSVGGAKPSTLPVNLDEFKVAELKQELKLRGLTVSGTKNDLIERLKNYQEQNGGSSAAAKTAQVQLSGAIQQQAKDVKTSSFPVAAATRVHATTPPQIMRFSSTSSSPPASPTPSDRSLAALSPDEASCNGDVFGEMVSSPLTQLSLHPSPEHPSPVKEEPLGRMQACCSLSRTGPLPSAPSLDKDQMLQEKDKQIEELTRMLRQKQRLVETLRSQLEQGKRGAAAEGANNTVDTEMLSLPNGLEVKVKEEVKEEMDTSEDPLKQVQLQKKLQTQCSQQTLLKLQQIQRLQLQQQQLLQQQQVLVDLPNLHQQKTQLVQQQRQQMQMDPKVKQEQGKAQVLQQQQKTQLQQQKTQMLQQQKMLLLQQQQQKTQLQQQQKLQQQKTTMQQQRLQQLIVQQTQQKQLQANQKQQQNTQNQPQQLQTPQVSQVLVNQQTSPQITTSFPLDLLKSHGTPTLVTDSNGNRYLIALTSNGVDSLTGKSPQSKSNGRITLQRLQSTPTKLPSQSSTDVTNSANQSQAVREPVTKIQKVGLHLDTTSVQESSQPVSAPPSFEPFFTEESNSLGKPSSPPPFKEEVCPTFDRHTLFTPSSPKPNPPRFKENISNNQQIDDLFEILIKSGEISSGFKANQDPSLSDFHNSPPSPSPPPSPLHLSLPAHHPDPAPPQQHPDTQDRPCSGTGRLEDFLESSTWTPLLGVEPDGPLTLIDDLHNQMLSTSSILDHPPTPMDTSDLSFSTHPASLDFEDPTLDGMDWLDIPMGGGGSNCNGAGMVLAPLSSHTPPSVFSADFLDSSDLQLHWDSCL